MPQISPDDKARIEAWNHSGNQKVRLQVMTTKDAQSGSMEQFCDQVMQIAPRISIRKTASEDGQGPQIRPAPNIRYSAVPVGAELELFLTSLDGLQNFANRLPLDLQSQAVKIEVPAPVKVYIAPLCPHCPPTVSNVMALAAVNINIQLTVIDGMLFGHWAQIDQVKSTPTTIVDNLFRWTGAVQLDELIAALRDRDPIQLSDTILRQMLEDGRAETVARMMADGGKIFPAYMKLLTHDKWPVRLAAMVVCEYLAEADPALAVEVVDSLWSRFDAVEDTIKGDILHVLGENRSAQAVSRLQAVVSGPYPSAVREIAAEILADLLN